jgi:fatty-acid desaturase
MLTIELYFCLKFLLNASSCKVTDTSYNLTNYFDLSDIYGEKKFYLTKNSFDNFSLLTVFNLPSLYKVSNLPFSLLYSFVYFLTFFIFFSYIFSLSYFTYFLLEYSFNAYNLGESIFKFTLLIFGENVHNYNSLLIYIS